MTKNKPLKIFINLLRWYCDPLLFEEISGDLYEGFIQNRVKKGPFLAQCIYALEVLALIRPSVVRPATRHYKSRPFMMMANYIKVTRRSFIRNRTYASINVVGLGVALACCLATYVNYSFNTSYDEEQRNIDRIHRVNYLQFQGVDESNFAVTPIGLGPQLKEIAGIDAVTQYASKRGTVRFDDDYFDFHLGFADDQFLGIFNFPVLSGSVESLKESSAIGITRATAIKYFQDENAIGQSITYLDQGQQKEFLVTVIFQDLPLNSSFRFNGMANLNGLSQVYKPDAGEWNQYLSTFLLVGESQSTSVIAQSITELAAERLTANHPGQTIEFYLDPLKGMAARAADNELSSPLKEAMPWPIYVVPGVISMLILLVTIFTFVNTFIASAAKRLKEIGIRKVMGGRRSQIIAQFIGESVAICLLALILAIPISNFLVEQYGQLLPFYDIDLNKGWDFFLFLAIMIVTVGIMAGSYPAFYISKFQPAGILKGETQVKGVGRISKLLLGAQLGFSMLALVSSILFVQNAHYQNNLELGFDTDETVVVRLVGGAEQYAPLKAKLGQNPKVSGITGAGDHVGRRFHTTSVRIESVEFEAVEMNVGENYIDIVELDLVSGRDFIGELQSDYDQSVIVSESFVKRMGWVSPIGKQVTLQDTAQHFVVGVVKDFYFDTFNSELQPLILNFSAPQEFRYLIARTHAANVTSLQEETKLAWKEVFQNQEFDIDPASHALHEGTIVNTIILKLFVFMGSIAVIMSLIGLFSLISLNLAGRMKEIGIRKVLGSSIPALIRVINRDYIVLLFVGIIAGSLISYFLIPAMMSAMWAHHIAVGPGLFIIAIALMLLVSIATVAFRVISAARVNASNLLRTE